MMQIKTYKTKRGILTANARRISTPNRVPSPYLGRYDSRAFTLVEVLVASALVGIMTLAFMGSFSTCFQNIQYDRENSRATQILLEKTELLRLYNWDQITGNDPDTFIPTNFTAPFYPTTNDDGGLTYSGTVTITDAPLSETYASDMRYVTINLTWTSGRVQRTRTMSSYVSKYGLQNYIY